MFPILFALGFGSIHRTWYAIPLIIVISLVYSASRYESAPRILRRALRLGLTIAGFMAAVFALLVVCSYGL